MYPRYCTISYFDNVLNKINIISAAEGLWGINVNDEHFFIRGWVIFGDVFLSPLLHNIHLRGKKNRKTNRQIVQIKLKEKKKEKRKKKKEKR